MTSYRSTRNTPTGVGIQSRRSDGPRPIGEATVIDCDSCPGRDRLCGDCFVPVLGQLWLRQEETGQETTPSTPATGTTRGGTVERGAALDSDELSAVAAFVRAGLVSAEDAEQLRADVAPLAAVAG